MSEPDLLAATGDPQVDAALRGVVRLIGLVFPGRASSIFLDGSYADGAATPLSDLDVTVVFDGALASEERARFVELLAACKPLAPLSLDLTPVGADDLARAGSLAWGEAGLLFLLPASLKYNSRPLLGADIRPQIPLVPRDTYLRCMMHLAAGLLIGLRRPQRPIPVPLEHLDSGDPFFGYTGRALRGRDGAPVPSTKRLLHTTMYAASALIALHSGLQPGSKRQAVRLYREQIGDGWADLLEQLQSLCYTAWGYRVPEAPADRATLRALCEQGLAFANHFLAAYHDFLLDELRHAPEDGLAFAQERLETLGFA